MINYFNLYDIYMDINTLNDKSLNIIALGDMGTGTIDQYKVAEGLKKLNDNINIDFVLGLGDNIYPDGVGYIGDPQFVEKFEKPYSILPENIEFYMTLGNHDYRNRINPQINYTRKNNRWLMPGRYYQFSKKVDNIIVDFFAIDTNLVEMSMKEIEEQKKWLKKQLKASKAKWKIVFGHHPWKSSGSHGDSKGVIDKFYTDILPNKVDILLNGHDHDKQHIICRGVNMFITGTGCQIRSVDPEIRNTYNNLKFYEETLGYCLLKISKNKIILHFLDENNRLEYIYHVEK
jgi:tartrate-resistant acid phosphatase type 5